MVDATSRFCGGTSWGLPVGVKLFWPLNCSGDVAGLPTPRGLLRPASVERGDTRGSHAASSVVVVAMVRAQVMQPSSGVSNTIEQNHRH